MSKQKQLKGRDGNAFKEIHNNLNAERKTEVLKHSSNKRKTFYKDIPRNETIISDFGEKENPNKNGSNNIKDDHASENVTANNINSPNIQTSNYTADKAKGNIQHNTETIRPPNINGGYFNARSEKVKYNNIDIQATPIITYGQLDQKLIDDNSNDKNKNEHNTDQTITDTSSTEIQSRNQSKSKSRINDNLNLKDKSRNHNYTKKYYIKSRYKNKNQSTRKLSYKNKSAYNYYTTDSDNDGVADVNDASDYDSTVQSLGDISKKKRKKSKAVPEPNSKQKNKKAVKETANKASPNKSEKKSSKQPEKLDKKIIKRKNRLIFNENQPKRNVLNGTGNILAAASIAAKEPLASYGEFESLKDSDNNSAVQAIGKGLNLTKRGTRKKVNRLNQGLRTHSKKARIKKLDKKSTRLRHNARFERALKKNKVYKNSKGLSKHYQRLKLKRKYSKKVNGSLMQRLQKGLKSAGKMAKKIILLIVKRFGIYIAGALLATVIISILVNFIMGLFSSGVSMIVSMSYQATDLEITNANNYYQELETNLLYAINNVESDYPDYDEYRPDVESISHDPHEIVAYLTAKYGEFKVGQVKNDLGKIFNEQYIYTLTEVIEKHTKNVETKVIDPETNEEVIVIEEVEYDWYVLEIKLERNNLEQILLANLDDEQKELYSVLMETKGNYISFPSPINKEWHSAISSHFGYRIDPITEKVAFHTGVDIAQPEGTDLIAIFDGVVLYTGFDADGYGNYVIIQQNDTGMSALYGHCLSIEVEEGSEIKVGDVVAKLGSTGRSTGSHVHFEIRDSDGNKLNPYFYLEN